MEWKEVRLGDIADVQTGPFGSQLHKSDYIAEGIPCIMPTNIGPHLNFIVDGIAHVSEVDANRLSRHLTEIGDIIYARRGDIEKCAYVTTNEEKWLCGTGCLKIRCNNEVNSRFIAYLLSTAECKKWITGNAVGTTMLNLSKGILSNLPLLVPSHEDQRRIASILSSLDRKIELNNKINADLEEMAQAIFKNWFVDFEPFKDGKFVDSELGMIPEGWEVGSLGDFCNVFTGKKNTNQAIEKGLYPFFSCAPEPLASNDAIFSGKAIIIAGNGSYTGRTSFYNGGFDLYQRTYACTIREQDKENLMIFFYHMMKQFFEPVKMGGTRGSSIPYIVMGDITQQKFPYSEEWLIRFSNIVNSMMDRKLRIDKENSRLSLLRDTLLPRLMSGELEVPE